MPFVPPRCPNQRCSAHLDPPARFCRAWGSYKPKCRRFRIPRFRCRCCGKTFSRQTFRVDYRDRRPETNRPLIELVSAGVGLREAGRKLHLRVRSVQWKVRKIARQLRALHDNFANDLPAGSSYLMDELQSFAGSSIRPVTLPLVVERESWFVVSMAVGSIRRPTRPGSTRRRRQEHDEARNGRRRETGRETVATVLRELDARAAHGPLRILTDRKPRYRTLVPSALGPRAQHLRHAKGTTITRGHPLLPVHVTIGMARDHCSRLRPGSWLAARSESGLRDQVTVFVAYRNYARQRFNRDPRRCSPAQQLGLVPRRFAPNELLRWRQDWGPISPSPISLTARRTIAQIPRAEEPPCRARDRQRRNHRVLDRRVSALA